MAQSARNATNNPALTYTLDDFINLRYTDELTYRRFSILEVDEDTGLEMLDHNLVDDYLDELEAMCINCELTTDQTKQYKYSPDLLAFDVYGTTQLDFVILKANDMEDPKEFTLSTSKVMLPYASQLQAFLSQIYNSNYNYLAQSRADNGLTVY